MEIDTKNLISFYADIGLHYIEYLYNHNLEKDSSKLNNNMNFNTISNAISSSASDDLVLEGLHNSLNNSKFTIRQKLNTENLQKPYFALNRVDECVSILFNDCISKINSINDLIVFGCNFFKEYFNMKSSCIFLQDDSIESNILVVGGFIASDDFNGIFSGSSGKMIDKMFKLIGISKYHAVNLIPHDLGIIDENIIEPSYEQYISFCKTFLDKYISLLRCEFIIFFGSLVSKKMLNAIVKQDVQKNLFQYNGMYCEKSIPSLVTYHPQFLIKFPQYKKYTWNHLLFLKDLIKNIF